MVNGLRKAVRVPQLHISTDFLQAECPVVMVLLYTASLLKEVQLKACFSPISPRFQSHCHSVRSIQSIRTQRRCHCCQGSIRGRAASCWAQDRKPLYASLALATDLLQKTSGARIKRAFCVCFSFGSITPLSELSPDATILH